MATPKTPTPALIRSTALRSRGDSSLRLLPAALVGVIVHVALVAGLIFLLDAPGHAQAELEAAASNAARNLAIDQRNLREDKKKTDFDKLGSEIVNPLAKEPDFDPLRGREDFKKLVAEFEATVGPKAKPRD